MSFKPPTEEDTTKALGDISTLPTVVQRAITNQIDESFQPIPRPRAGDWLRAHGESGQTFQSFQNRASKAVPHATYKTIFIQPFGSFDHPRAVSLSVVLEFARAFFAGCETELLPTIDFPKEFEHRINPSTGAIQYKTEYFHNYLSKTRTSRNPRKELLCVAVTMADLYPDDSWNFVYGQAFPTNGVGVYSFARLDPLFPMPLKQSARAVLSNAERILILRRCVKILLHELGHLFGLAHCIYYVCLMNGANHEIEMDRQPLYLCPVCLRKLHSTLQFDIPSLYERFGQLCEHYELEEETAWYRKRLQYLS